MILVSPGLEVARKYILPDHYVMVEVGAEFEPDKAKEPAPPDAAGPEAGEAGLAETENIDLPVSSEDNKDSDDILEDSKSEAIAPEKE